MRVALLGATGNLGRLLLQQLLTRGHQVTALVRTPEKIIVKHPALTIAHGSAREPAVIADLIAGQDAVINAVGGEGDIRSVVVANLIAAMRQCGIARLVNIGGAGILQVGPLYLYQLPVFPSKMVAVTVEHRKVFETLRRSDLDWTMVCPPFMSADPATGRFAVKAEHPFLLASLRISLADVAKFVVDELEQCGFVRQRVAIAPC